MKNSMRYAIPRWYYLATPVFVVLDYVAGVNIRVAVLDSMPLYKNLYYGVCIVFGVFVFFQPKTSPFVALFESMINILMTALATFLPYLEHIEHMADISGNWKAAETFGVEGAVNVVIVGIVGVIAFRLSLGEIAKISGWKGGER